MGRLAHVFHATRHNHTGVSKCNGLGRQVDGFQAGAADFIHCHGGGFHAQSGIDAGLAGGVLTTAGGQYVAHDHFIYQLWLNV